MKKSLQSDSSSASGNGEEEWAVEYIYDKRVINGKVEYAVKWKDWPKEHNTWEPKKHLTHCKWMVAYYENCARANVRNGLIETSSDSSSMSGSETSETQVQVEENVEGSNEIVAIEEKVDAEGGTLKNLGKIQKPGPKWSKGIVEKKGNDQGEETSASCSNATKVVDTKGQSSSQKPFLGCCSSPKPGPGRQSILNLGPGGLLILKSGPGRPSKPKSGPGRQSILNLGPGGLLILKSGPGRPSKPKSGPGRPSKPKSGPGRPSNPKSAPGRPSKPKSGPRRPYNPKKGARRTPIQKGGPPSRQIQTKSNVQKEGCIQENEAEACSSNEVKETTNGKFGFDRNLEPEHIFSVMKDDSGVLRFLMKWKDSTILDWVPVKDANQICPKIVIDFYSSRQIDWAIGRYQMKLM